MSCQFTCNTWPALLPEPYYLCITYLLCISFIVLKDYDLYESNSFISVEACVCLFIRRQLPYVLEVKFVLLKAFSTVFFFCLTNCWLKEMC